MKEYKIICPKGKRPPENEEIIIGEVKKSYGDSLQEIGNFLAYSLKDMETMENMMVRAIVSSKKEVLEDPDILWIQSEESYDVEPDNWYIKILEHIEEDELEVKVLPKMHISMGKQRGGMLKSLMKKGKKD